MRLRNGLALHGPTRTGGAAPPLSYTPPGSAVLWIDPTVAASITLNGGDIASIASQVGSVVASQATAANQPLLEVAGMNGRNCMRFSASTDYLDLGGTFAALFNGDDTLCSVWWVMQTFSSGSTNMRIPVIGFGNTGDATQYHFPSFGWTGNNLLRYTRRGTGDTEKLQQTGVHATNTTYLFGAEMAASAVAKFWEKNVNVFSPSLNTTAITANTALISAINLGGTITPSHIEWRCGDILVYNSPLSSPQVTDVTNYLVAKWAVP